ncbi:MAG: hypothetical protein U0641_18055 [Anaerolineae bacterium]
MLRTLVFGVTIFLALLALLSALFNWSQASAQGVYDLSWWTVDGGGGRSLGGEESSSPIYAEYDLSGTIGQADAGALGNVSDEVGGGFWKVGRPLYRRFWPSVTRNLCDLFDRNQYLDQAARSQPLAPGGDYFGQFCDDNHYDYYLVNVPAGATTTIRLDQIPNGRDFDLGLYGPIGVEVRGEMCDLALDHTSCPIKMESRLCGAAAEEIAVTPGRPADEPVLAGLYFVLVYRVQQGYAAQSCASEPGSEAGTYYLHLVSQPAGQAKDEARKIGPATIPPHRR